MMTDQIIRSRSTAGLRQDHGALESLVAAAAAFSGAERDSVSAVVDWLIAPAHAPSASQKRRSILNNDALPLQVCLTSSATRLSVRLIGDPCTGVAHPAERFHSSRRLLEAMIQRTGSQGLVSHCEHIIRQTLPLDLDGLAGLEYGGLWLATGVPKSNAIAVYTTLDWGEASAGARWRRVRGWLDSTLPEGSNGTAQLGELLEFACPVSAGLEGRSEADAVAKVYFRTKKASLAAGVELDAFASREFVDFSARVLAGRTLPDSGTLYCAGFALSSGKLVSNKLDICGHCVPRSPEEWQDILNQLTERVGVRPVPIQGRLAEHALDVAFIGLGRSLHGECRINIYLKARSPAES